MTHYTIASIFLFFIGICGIFVIRSNIIIILMSLELVLLSVNLNFLITSNLIDDAVGQIFSFLVLTVAAAEVAIGLAILVVYYRLRGFISVDFIKGLKG